MPFAINDGVRVAYERAGPDGSPTVVFVEGLGYGRWMWRWQRRVLSEFDTICPDNRGTGDSEKPEGPYTIEQMAGDLEAVLDDADIERAHVAGASMGGMIALQYALEYTRAETLTLMCTSPGGPDTLGVPAETQERMFDVPDGLDTRAELRYKMEPAMTDEFLTANDELIERIIDWRLESDASEQARRWQSAAVTAFDVSDRLDDIRLPVLVMHGTADRVVPVDNGELIASSLPNAEFARVEGGSHLFFIEQADRVNERLLEFLDDG